jgi:hypothetical protein
MPRTGNASERKKCGFGCHLCAFDLTESNQGTAQERPGTKTQDLYCASGEDFSTALVDGRILMR